ncbi:MAG: Xaa-Pro aminopeptidase [Coxiellaceae bacterium]|nr:MAG: Xaa-Pro aminopeptidase [Coxiellaceae bacterium]
MLRALPPNSMALVMAAPESRRNGDVDYLYRQNSDFYYLTGFPEPEAVALLMPGRPEGEYVLFNRERNLEAEIWNGIRAGQEGACSEYGANQAFNINTLDAKLPTFLTQYERIYYPIGQNRQFDQRVFGWINQLRAKVRAGVGAPSEVIDVSRLLHEMRLVKTPAEVAVMRKAAEISAQAHVHSMQTCVAGMREYEIAAQLLYDFYRQGCEAPAYSPIVGSGPNACVLHYVSNNRQIQDGDLVLIDAAGEYQNYAADITRTFPANGRFTAEQRAIYEVVLAAQMAVIAQIKPGVLWDSLQQTAVQVLTEGMVDVGLLQGRVDSLIAQQTYRQFYMHNVGHWLGMDVHDVGAYRLKNAWRPLEVGMAFTVEPGIYIRPSPEVDRKWWHIGVRIEDDVVVTGSGCDVLSKDVPKQVSEIEALMRK